MHIKTKFGAELNGRRFPEGTMLDLPDLEAAVLVDADMAEIVGEEPAPEADAEAPPPAGRKRR